MPGIGACLRQKKLIGYLRSVVYQGGEEEGAGRTGGGGALMSNLYLISHHWYDMEKLTVPGSSNLNLSFSGAQQNVLCEKDEEKMCYILF